MSLLFFSFRLLLHEFPDGVEVGVSHGGLHSYSLIFIILKHFVKQVKSLGRDHVLVLGVDEVCPWNFLELLTTHKFLYLLRDLEVVSVDIYVKVVFSKHAHDSDELVKVVRTLEEGVNLENHTCHCAA